MAPGCCQSPGASCGRSPDRTQPSPAPRFSHLGLDLRDHAEAVVLRDGELVVEDPGGQAPGGLPQQVAAGGGQVGHVLVRQHHVVAGAIDVPSYLGSEGGWGAAWHCPSPSQASPPQPPSP